MKPAIDTIGFENCTGCYGCYNSCPKGAIDMTLDNEGFMIPLIDRQKCINCDICQKHCPVINDISLEGSLEPKCFAAWSKNEETRISSSSGGVFAELAREILQEDGVVFGACFDENLIVRHRAIIEEKELELVKGSKYVQSHIDSTFKDVLSFLKHRRKVLFSGTSCQVAALNTFLDSSQNQEYLLTCDLICHGVPSETVFKSYVNNISLSMGSKISKFSFRDKTLGWKNSGTRIFFDNGKEIFQVNKENPFMIGFYENIYLRPACHDCKFARIPRVSDVTLGDFWGIPPEFYDNRGVSLVVTNTINGKIFLEKVSRVKKISISLDRVTNRRLINGHETKNKNREAFYNTLRKEGFESARKKYLRPKSKLQNILLRISSTKSRLQKVLSKIKNILLRIYPFSSPLKRS